MVTLAGAARAVLFLQELDAEIRASTDEDKDLDDVVRLLMKERRVDADDLREASQSVAGGTLETFASPLLGNENELGKAAR